MALWDQGVNDISNKLYGTELFQTYDPKAVNEQLTNISGPAYGVLTPEGGEYATNDLYKGYPYTLALRKFTSKLTISEEAQHFLAKQHEQGVKSYFTLNNPVEHALNALIGNHNLELAKMLYLGFGTTNFTPGDGVALFSNSHPIRRTGGTSGNMFASGDTQRALSVDAVKTALDRMNRALNQNGVQNRPVKRFRLVVPVELEATAWQILLSIYGPSANLGLSTTSPDIMEARGIPDRSVTVLPDIPSAYSTYWFIMDLDRMPGQFLKVQAWGPRMDEQAHPDNGSFSNDCSTLLQFVANGWTCVFGSKGDGTSIS
jgi:hypothetical protein